MTLMGRASASIEPVEGDLGGVGYGCMASVLVFMVTAAKIGSRLSSRPWYGSRGSRRRKKMRQWAILHVLEVLRTPYQGKEIRRIRHGRRGGTKRHRGQTKDDGCGLRSQGD